MSLTIVSTPNKTINTIESNVAGVLSQLPYQFKRTDFTTASYDDAAGKQRVLLSGGVDLTSQFTTGDSIYIEGNSVIPDDVYTVDVIDFTGNTRLTLTIDTLFSGAEVNNVNLLTGSRLDYRVNMFIKNSDNTELILSIPLAYQTKANGDLFVDIKDVILPLMVGLEDLVYDVEYFESYGSVVAGVTATGNTQATRAKSQAGDLGGSNEWELLGVQGSTAGAASIIQVSDDGSGKCEVIVFGDVAGDFSVGDIVRIKTADNSYDDVTTVASVVGTSVVNCDLTYRGEGSRGTLSAHFGSILTKFKEPLLWEGWKRTLTAIRDKNWDTRTNSSTAQFEFRGADVNKQILNDPLVSGATTVVSIVTGVISEEKKIEDDAYYVRALLTTSDPLPMSNPLFYKVERECQRPIYVEWVNSLGGSEQHLFSVQQDVLIDTILDIQFNSPIVQDLEFALNTKQRRVIDQVQRVTVEADKLTIDQYRAVAEIKFSDNVFVYLTKDGSKKIRVRITQLTSSQYTTKARGTAWSIAIQLEFPDNFDIHNVFDLTLEHQRPRVLLGNLIDSDDSDLIDDDNDNLTG